MDITVNIPSIDRLADVIERAFCREDKVVQMPAPKQETAPAPVQADPTPATVQAEVIPEPTEPTPVPQISLEDVQKAAVQLADTGKGPALMSALSATFGVQYLNQIPQDRYAEAMDLFKQMGANV